MKWDTCIQIAQGLEASKGERCTKASDMETDECFLFYMHVFCNFFSKSMTQRMKRKCVATDYKSLVVSITPQYEAYIIHVYIHNINICIGFQKSL